MPEEKPTDTSQPARAASSAPPRWRRLLIALFVVTYISIQLLVPAFGLYVRETTDTNATPFSWHMFSKLALEPSEGEGQQ